MCWTVDGAADPPVVGAVPVAGEDGAGAELLPHRLQVGGRQPFDRRLRALGDIAAVVAGELVQVKVALIWPLSLRARIARRR